LAVSLRVLELDISPKLTNGNVAYRTIIIPRIIDEAGPIKVYHCAKNEYISILCTLAKQSDLICIK